MIAFSPVSRITLPPETARYVPWNHSPFKIVKHP